MFSGLFEPVNLLVILVVVLLVFGPKKLRPRGGPPAHPLSVTGPAGNRRGEKSARRR